MFSGRPFILFEVRTIEAEKRSVPELWTEVPALKIRSKVFVLIFPATPTKTKNHLQSWFISRVGYIQRLGLSKEMKPLPNEATQSLQVSDPAVQSPAVCENGALRAGM